MTLIASVLVGCLYAAGVFMLLRRNIVKMLLGLVFLSHAANLFLFTTGGLTSSRAPIVPPEAAALPAGAADPLPQALVLTAIVISFAVLAFMMALLDRHHELTATEDSDELRRTEA